MPDTKVDTFQGKDAIVRTKRKNTSVLLFRFELASGRQKVEFPDVKTVIWNMWENYFLILTSLSRKM